MHGYLVFARAYVRVQRHRLVTSRIRVTEILYGSGTLGKDGGGILVSACGAPPGY